ncbi:ELF1 isoform 4 [Pongo abelii]|uniref:ELF1 isoform 4 n=1 Tax=Pongo abelii TaxID=9601 RepID=A0A2J8VSU6_PONAB|nr:ELF1 isoform 4 [Pongo abelii]
MAAVVQQNDLVFEFASNVMEDERQLGDPAIFPAVIVEHVPGADILNSYAGLACVEEPNDMITESSLDVAEEEIIDDDDDDITLTVETGFLHVSKSQTPDLKQSACLGLPKCGITGMSHCAGQVC